MIAAPPPVTGNDGFTPGDSPPAVEMRNVTKTYPGPVVALDQISLRVGRGQALAIIGASGSGKSTLLHLMGTLDAPTAGEVLVDGHHTGHLGDRQLAALRSRYLVLDLLLGLHHAGTALVVITHDLNVAARLPARVQVADGRIKHIEGLQP